MPKHFSPDQKDYIIEEYLKSGLTLYEYSKNQPFSRHSFRIWLIEYQSKNSKKNNDSLIKKLLNFEHYKVSKNQFEHSEKSNLLKKLALELLKIDKISRKDYQLLSQKFENYHFNSLIKTAIEKLNPSFDVDYLINNFKGKKNN